MRLHEDSAALPGPARAGSGDQRIVELGEGTLEEVDDVHRVPPRVRLLHALGARELRRQRGQHCLGCIPTRDVERLQGFVHEVQRVATVEIAVIGRGSEEHVRELAGRRSATHGRDERPLGTLRISDVDEVPEPQREARGLGHIARERIKGNVRRPHDRVGRDVGEPVVERRVLGPPGRAAARGS